MHARSNRAVSRADAVRPFFSAPPARASSFFSASPFAVAAQLEPDAAGGESIEPAPVIQTKLAMGVPGDPFEQEADAMADRVVQGMHAGTVSPVTAPSVEAKGAAGLERAPSRVERTLAAPGAPLSTVVRRDMEDSFGRDFSGVRIHSDQAAAESAGDIAAAAYTAGNHVVFAERRFAPGTTEGQRLLAHELAHVVQQGAARPPAPLVQRQEAADADQAAPEDTSLTGRLARETIRRVAESAASVMRRALPVPIPETIMAALVAAIGSFLYRSYVRLAQQGEAFTILGRVRELLNPATAASFYFRYLWGILKGLVSPVTGLVHLAIGAVQFQAAAIQWLETLPSRAPELVNEANELRAAFDAFRTRAETTLSTLRTREQLLAFAGAIFSAASGATDALQRMIVDGAQRQGERAADSLIQSFRETPLPELAETAGEIIGTVIIELVLLLFTEGIGNLITKLGEFARALRPLSSGVAAFARVAVRIGRIVEEIEHVVGVLLSRTVLRPLMPLFEALQPVLVRMQRFARSLVGLSERSATALAPAGAAVVERGSGAARTLPRGATTPPVPTSPARTRPPVSAEPTTPPIRTVPPRRPPPPPEPRVLEPPPRPPRSRGATAEGVGESFRYEHHPPAAVEPSVEVSPRPRRPRPQGPAAPERPPTRTVAEDVEPIGDETTGAITDEATGGTGRGSRSPSDPEELNAPPERRVADPSEVEGLRPRYADDRFHWSVTEEDLSLVAQELFPGRAYDPATRGEIVFSGGQRVDARVAGSTVPDLYLPGTRRTRPISLEAKNVFLGDPQAYDDFVVSTVVQARQRVAALPRTAEQHVVIDFRGQDVTRELVAGLKRDLMRRSGGILRYDRIHAWPLSLN